MVASIESQSLLKSGLMNQATVDMFNGEKRMGRNPFLNQVL